MQPVYTITHTFLDLIQRHDVFPASLNHSELINTPKEQIPEVLKKHWPEILMQYVGVATIAICGILMAIIVPLAGFCVCCCRCAGKCGASNITYDKKGDACKRLTVGILLSVFVVAAMFGVVSAFVNNQVKYFPRCLEPTSAHLPTTDLFENVISAHIIKSITAHYMITNSVCGYEEKRKVKKIRGTRLILHETL